MRGIRGALRLLGWRGICERERGREGEIGDEFEIRNACMGNGVGRGGGGGVLRPSPARLDADTSCRDTQTDRRTARRQRDGISQQKSIESKRKRKRQEARKSISPRPSSLSKEKKRMIPIFRNWNTVQNLTLFIPPVHPCIHTSAYLSANRQKARYYQHLYSAEPKRYARFVL